MLLFRFCLCSSYFSCKSKLKENEFAAVKQCTIFVLVYFFFLFFCVKSIVKTGCGAYYLW